MMYTGYALMMRTTLSIDDQLLAQAKADALRSGRTLGQVVEDALRLALASRPTVKRRPVSLPTHDGVLRDGIDLDDSAALLEIMEVSDPAV